MGEERCLILCQLAGEQGEQVIWEGWLFHNGCERLVRLKATGRVAGALNTSGRVDQLEDRYLGMVEAASSNLAASTTIDGIDKTAHE